MPTRDTRPMSERFWEKVDRSGGPDACWLWCASLRQGYGQFAIARGHITTAHRAAWLITNGEFPAPGLYVRHLCESIAAGRRWAHLSPNKEQNHAER